MNGLFHAVEPFARSVTSVLVNVLWEDVAIFAVIAILLRAWPRLNAATRYAFWFVALVASIAVPVLSTFWPVEPAASASIATTTHHRMAVKRISASVTAGDAAIVHGTTAKKVESQPSGIASDVGARAFVAPRIVVSVGLADAVLALWIVALALFLARLALGLARLERLKKNALPLPLEHRDALARLGSAPHGGRDIRICVSDEASVPVAVGLFDSMILVPRHLLDSLTHEDVEHVCLHEMAHLRRADDWTNLLQRLATALAWFSPAVYAIARGLDLEREVACDDDVVATMGAVRPYARCLTKMAEITAWPHDALAAPGVFVTRRGISERIERLLRAGRNAARGLSLGPAAAALAVIVFLTLGMRTVAPIAAAPLATPAPIATLAPMATLAPRAPRSIHTARTTHVHVPATHVHVPGTYVHVPAVHVQVPAVNVHVPAIDVNVPGVDVHVPAIDVNVPETSAWKHVYAGTHGCSACDFSDVNWSGRDLHGRRYDGADFSDGRFVGTNFSRAYLRGTDFSNADLRTANFDGAQLSGCDFSDADLRGATFRGANVQRCSFSDVHFDDAQARDILGSCQACDMSNDNLSGADLSGMTLTHDDFSGSNLSRADFRGAHLTGVDLSDANLNGARFAGATLVDCDLSGVDRSHVDLSQARLVHVGSVRSERRER